MASVLGVFGGTFDPIHCGHLELARELRETLALSAIRFVPAGNPPHRSAPAASRRAPCSQWSSLRWRIIRASRSDAREIERKGRSYTVHDARRVARRGPRRALALILGAGCVPRLADLASLARGVRPGASRRRRAARRRAGAPLSPELARERSHGSAESASVLFSRNAGASSSPGSPRTDFGVGDTRMPRSPRQPRYRLRRGLLPAAVLAYIERNHLYLSPQDAT
jgi:nicotinate-nucleotide adenylyltransferase